MEKYLFDYHVHTFLSMDGHESIYSMCESAIEKGLKEIAITDHFESLSYDPDSKAYKPMESLRNVIVARDKYEGKLTVKLGIELGQPHRFMKNAASVLSKVPYDYVIGSVHAFPDDTDASEIDYSSVSIEDIGLRYLAQIKLLAETGDFDCVGHMDLVRRYRAKRYGSCSEFTLMMHKDMLEEVLKTIIQRGKGIEINTSGLRQALGDTMPGFDVVKFYRELGGEILTVGSDAHHAKDVGKNIEDAAELAKKAGFKYLTLFSGRKPEMITIK